MNISLNELRSFVEVVRLGSFSEAAKVLGLTQPGVSRQIQKLERELAAPLIRRSEGPLSLTEAGKHVYEFAESTLQDHECLRLKLKHLEEPLGGELRIAASTIPGEFLVPHLLASYRREHPCVRLSATITDSEGVLGAIARHEAAIGFAGLHEEREGFLYYPFIEDEILIGLPSDHPFCGRKSVRIEELSGQRFVMREGGSGTKRSLFDILASQGLRLPEHEIAMTLGSSQAVHAAIRSGAGIGFISRLALEQDSRGMCGVRLDGVSLKRQLYLVLLEGHRGLPLISDFIAFARRWAERHPHPSLS